MDLGALILGAVVAGVTEVVAGDVEVAKAAASLDLGSLFALPVDAAVVFEAGDVLVARAVAAVVVGSTALAADADKATSGVALVFVLEDLGLTGVDEAPAADLPLLDLVDTSSNTSPPLETLTAAPATPRRTSPRQTLPPTG